MKIYRRIKEYFKAHPIIKTGASYSVWGTIKHVCTTLVGLAVMRWLTPDELGMWNTVSIFLAYTPFLQLGIQSGLNTELPVFLGKNDTKTAEERIANGYGYAILVSILILILGLIFSVRSYSTNGLQECLGVVTITISAICSSFQLHLIARFRSSKSFDKLVTIMRIEIPITLMCVFLIYKLGYWGILLNNCIISLSDVILMFWKAPFKYIKPAIQKPVLFKMGKLGIAMMVLVQLRTAAQTLPRWIILMKSNRTKLGLYTPATAIGSLINLVPGQFAQFFYPQMGYKYGQTGNASTMWPYIKKMFWILPLAVLPISAAIYLLSPWLLQVFFPKYVDSLWAMRIMCITFLFTSANGTTMVFNSMKAFKFSYACSLFHFIGCFIWPYIATSLLSADILTSVTIGLAFNEFLAYIVNYTLLRYALFLPKYNKIDNYE